jgi:hypothetical protein
MEPKLNEKAFLMYMTGELHHELKKRASKYNMTMKEYVTRILNEQIIKENRYEQVK